MAQLLNLDSILTCPLSVELTIGEVRLRLAQEEQERGVSAVRGRDESSEAAFIVLGMEIEVAQSVLPLFFTAE